MAYFNLTSLVSRSPLSDLSSRLESLNQLSLPGPPKELDYTALSPVDDDASQTHISDDAVSTYSTTAPHFGYQPYRPPPRHSDQLHIPSRQPSATTTYTEPTRLPTPPPQQRLSWPGNTPSRVTPRSKTQPVLSRSPSLGVRAQQTQPYDEALPWANHSTHFRTTSSHSAQLPYQYDASIHSEDTTRPSKQYFRSPRHIREAWQTGGSKRFPWKGMGALLGVLLLTGTSITLLFAFSTANTRIPTSTSASTLLSALEIPTILLTLLALRDGISLSFWLQVLGGTTMSGIHDTHKCSTSIFHSLSLLTIRHRWDKTAFATLFSVLSLSRGPLFQASLSPSPSPQPSNDGPYILNPIPMALAMIFSFGSVFALIPLYYGYWTLGRVVSLSPLEVARAFGSPLFDGLDGNVSAADIECARGHVGVKYGVVERSGAEKVLRMEFVGRTGVRRPREGEIFG